MTFLRRLTIAATAILGLAFAPPSFAQGVPRAPTNAEAGGPVAAISAFAQAFFDDDYEGMLAQLPTLISATLDGGDSGTAAVLEAMGDAIASDDHAAFQSTIRVLERLSTYGMAKRIYDAILDIAISLGPSTGFTQWTKTGAARTEHVETRWFDGEDGPFALRADFGTPSANPQFTGFVGGYPQFGAEVFAVTLDAYVAEGSILLVGPDDMVTPAPFDMVPNATGLLLPEASYDASWVEALSHADALVVVLVLGDGDIAQFRYDIDSTGHAMLSRAFLSWGYSAEAGAPIDQHAALWLAIAVVLAIGFVVVGVRVSERIRRQ